VTFFSEASIILLIPHGAKCNPVEIDLADTLSTVCGFKGHSSDTLKTADSTDKIEALKVPRTATDHKSRKLFALPPFVGAKFVDMDPLPSQFDAFLIISKALSEYDTENGSNLYGLYLTSMNFLLAFGNNDDDEASAPTTFVPAIGTTATAWALSFSDNHLDAIQTQVAGHSDLITNAATNVAANLSGLQNEIHCLRTDPMTDKSKEKGHFGSWHQTNRQMVLFASSTDGDSSPAEPTAFLQIFCKIKGVTDAVTELTNALSTDHACTVEVSNGLITSLQKGIWLLTNQLVPSNLTILAVPRPNGHTEGAAQELVLTLKSETPSLFTDSDLKNLTRQPLFPPSNADELQAHCTNMSGLLALLLGKDSLLTCFAETWAEHLRENYVSYANQAASYHLFIRKILFAFDIRVQNFLRMCMTKKTREDVHSSILESSEFLQQITMFGLQVNLPTTYHPATPEPTTDGLPFANPSSKKRPKENPANEEDWGPLVKNNNRVPAWDILRLNIAFRQFCTFDNPGPPDICRKWHLKGSCRQNYPRRASHSILVVPAKKAFSQWFNSCT
jgi:hypothetical protein